MSIRNLVAAIQKVHGIDTSLSGEDRFATIAEAYPHLRWFQGKDAQNSAIERKTPLLTLEEVEAAVVAYAPPPPPRDPLADLDALRTRAAKLEAALAAKNLVTKAEIDAAAAAPAGK